MTDVLDVAIGGPLSALAARGRRRSLDAGEVLFRECDASEHVYVCITGRIRLMKSAANGREIILDVLLPGDVFGEVSAIDGAGRTSAASAMDRSEVVELSGREFLAALRDDPDIALISMRGLARRLRQANERICAGETERVVARLARLLQDLVDRLEQAGVSRPQDLHFTQTDLAEWLGATREATARALGELRRDGVLRTGRSLIVVDDRPALERWM